MTAQEFVTCIAVMAGAAKVKERKPKQPRLVVIRRIRVSIAIEISRIQVRGIFRASGHHPRQDYRLG
jgi:hypothetical protein